MNIKKERKKIIAISRVLFTLFILLAELTNLDRLELDLICRGIFTAYFFVKISPKCLINARNKINLQNCYRYFSTSCAEGLFNLLDQLNINFCDTRIVLLLLLYIGLIQLRRSIK